MMSLRTPRIHFIAQRAASLSTPNSHHKIFPHKTCPRVVLPRTRFLTGSLTAPRFSKGGSEITWILWWELGVHRSGGTHSCPCLEAPESWKGEASSCFPMSDKLSYDKCFIVLSKLCFLCIRIPCLCGERQTPLRPRLPCLAVAPSVARAERETDDALPSAGVLPAFPRRRKVGRMFENPGNPYSDPNLFVIIIIIIIIIIIVIISCMLMISIGRANNWLVSQDETTHSMLRLRPPPCKHILLGVLYCLVLSGSGL